MIEKFETKAEIYPAIGNRLRVCRKKLGLTQEELSEMADVSAQMISTAERGQKGMMPENVIKICRALKISTDYLLRGDNGGDKLTLIFDRVKELDEKEVRRLTKIMEAFVDGVDEEEK